MTFGSILDFQLPSVRGTVRRVDIRCHSCV
jgi:hypothetical protein